MNTIHNFSSCQSKLRLQNWSTKTTITKQWIFKLTSQRLMRHLNLSPANSQAIILRITVCDDVRSPSIESIEDLQRYSIAAQHQMIIARVWCTLSVMKPILETIYLPPKCKHVEGFSFSGLDQSWQFPHTTNYESGQSSLYSLQRDSHTWHTWLLYSLNVPWPSPEPLKELSGHWILYQ